MGLKILNGSTPLSCGGTKVGSQHIVTAAHCLRSKNWRAKPSDVTVYMDSIEKWKGRVVKVSRVDTHPNFNVVSGANDIAVLTLSERIGAQGSASLTNDPVEEHFNEVAVVSGWGATEYQGGYNTLQILKVKVAKKCARSVRSFSYRILNPYNTREKVDTRICQEEDVKSAKS